MFAVTVNVRICTGARVRRLPPKRRKDRAWRAERNRPDRTATARGGARSKSEAAVQDRVRWIRQRRRILGARQRPGKAGTLLQRRHRVQARQQDSGRGRRVLAVGILLTELAMPEALARQARIRPAEVRRPVAIMYRGHLTGSHDCRVPLTIGRPAEHDRACMGGHCHLHEQQHPGQQAGDETVHGPGSHHCCSCR